MKNIPAQYNTVLQRRELRQKKTILKRIKIDAGRLTDDMHMRWDAQKQDRQTGTSANNDRY